MLSLRGGNGDAAIDGEAETDTQINKANIWRGSDASIQTMMIECDQA
jgi:hypothetical protein